MILQSPLLSRIAGVKHGFSTRLGGVSAGPFATLNLDAEVGDRPEHVRENWVRFGAMMGLEWGAEIRQVRQVHGTRVIDAGAPGFVSRAVEGDAVFVDRPGIAVGVRTADCVPVLIAAVDRSGAPQAVAAVHAGWRGACAGIVRAAIEVLEERGASRERMQFAIGPAIELAAFEVGPEVIEAARASIGGRNPPIEAREGAKPHLDLPGLLFEQLADLGVDRARVERVGGCTHDVAALYFSHRRDRGVTGRQLSAIAFTRPSRAEWADAGEAR